MGGIIMEGKPLASIRRAWVQAGRGAMPRGFMGEVEAEINHGRWIVCCPNPDCRGAVMAHHEEPRFLCPDCGSVDNGGLWRTVRFPTDKEQIEAALITRPVANRNRLRGERASDLLRENARHRRNH